MTVSTRRARRWPPASTVPSDVAILVEDGAGGWTLGSFDDLTEGTAVQVWFDGPVAESYPVQATAGSIVIEA